MPLPGGPIGPAQPGPAHLFLSPTVFNLLPVGRKACGRGARARARPAPACRCRWRLLQAPRTPTGPSLSPPSSPSPLDLSLFHSPNGFVAADRHHRGHQHPHAQTVSARAPPPRAEPLHRRKKARMASIVSPSPSPPPAAEDLHRRFATVVASPSSLTIST